MHTLKCSKTSATKCNSKAYSVNSKGKCGACLFAYQQERRSRNVHSIVLSRCHAAWYVSEWMGAFLWVIRLKST